MTVIHHNSDALISPTRRADAIDARGSALFPAGGARLYDRAAKARRPQKSMSIAMIAVPVAALAVGGAFYLSTMSGHSATATHRLAPVPAASGQSATRTTTQTTTAPVAAIGTRSDVSAASQIRPAQQSLRQAPLASNRARAARAAVPDASSALPDQPPAAASVAPQAATPGTFQFTPAAPVVAAPPVVAPAPVVDSAAPPTPATAPPASPPGV